MNLRVLLLLLCFAPAFARAQIVFPKPPPVVKHSPLLASFARATPAVSLIGAPVVFNFTTSATDSPFQTITVTLTDPTGTTRTIVDAYQPSSSVVAATTPAWPAGEYKVSGISVAISNGMEITYLRDGTISNPNAHFSDPFGDDEYVAPASHGFRFSDFDFKLAASTDGTAVAGVVGADTTWTPAGSPYRLTGNLQVAAGATLSIGPGVEVIGGGATIEVLGRLNVIGTAAAPATLLNTMVTPGINAPSAPFVIDIEHAVVVGGSVWPPTTDTVYGSVIIRDSCLAAVAAARITVRYPVADSVIERNVFFHSEGITAGVSNGYSPTVSIRNNLFYYPDLGPKSVGGDVDTDSAVTIFASSGGTFDITGNSFLGTPNGYGALKLSKAMTKPLSAPNNYYGTDDPQQVRQLIADAGINVGATAVITYTPFLTAADPSTPGAPQPPTIVSAPVAQMVDPNGTVSFSVTAESPLSVSYQWFKDGVVIPDATDRTFVVDAVATAAMGSYSVSVGNLFGATATTPVRLTINGVPFSPGSWLTNVSVRTALRAGQEPVIVGITTNGPQPIIMRAAGPALANYGVAQPLADPVLQYFLPNTSTPAEVNDNWDAFLAPTFASVGAFPFAEGSKDAAMLNPVNGSASVQELATGDGTVLVEAYTIGADTGAARLINVSARNFAGAGDNALIAGFAIRGTGMKRLLIRGIGPNLDDFGVPNVLADPRLDVFDANNTKIAGNDNWDGWLADTFTATGAFALHPGSRDAALIAELPAGSTYTVVVSGANGGTGTALIEIYEVP